MLGSVAKFWGLGFKVLGQDYKALRRDCIGFACVKTQACDLLSVWKVAEAFLSRLFKEVVIYWYTGIVRIPSRSGVVVVRYLVSPYRLPEVS